MSQQLDDVFVASPHLFLEGGGNNEPRTEEEIVTFRALFVGLAEPSQLSGLFCRVCLYEPSVL